MTIRDKAGIKTRAKAEFNVRWDEYSGGVKLVTQGDPCPDQARHRRSARRACQGIPQAGQRHH